MSGIRGPQVEFYDVELDKLTTPTSNILATVESVDLGAAGTTALYTATQKTYIFGVLLRATHATNITVFAETSCGVNPATDDMFANEILVGLTQSNNIYTFWNNLNSGMVLNASDQLDLSVNVPATADILLVTAYVIGVTL